MCTSLVAGACHATRLDRPFSSQPSLHSRHRESSRSCIGVEGRRQHRPCGSAELGGTSLRRDMHRMDPAIDFTVREVVGDEQIGDALVFSAGRATARMLSGRPQRIERRLP